MYLKVCASGREAKAGINAYFHSYNTQRPYETLGSLIPVEVFNCPAGDSSWREWREQKEGADQKET